MATYLLNAALTSKQLQHIPVNEIALCKRRKIVSKCFLEGQICNICCFMVVFRILYLANSETTQCVFSAGTVSNYILLLYAFYN